MICGVLEHCLDNGISAAISLHGLESNPLGLPELINGEWSIAVKMKIDENTLASWLICFILSLRKRTV